MLNFLFRDDGNAVGRDSEIKHGIVAGWTGRDAIAVARHIAELETLGVPRPASTPIFYRVSASRFTTATEIEATGTASSGEVEFALFKSGGRLWVGVASDHTDRDVEKFNVTVAKQMCDKPVAPEFWSFEDVARHWEKLILRSFIKEDDARLLYQEGSVASMIEPEKLLALYNGGSLEEGSMLLGGTLAARGGIRPSKTFAFEIEDPVLGRVIRHEYSVTSLANEG